MAKIIAVSAFRGGAGKSNITANLAALLATDGLRVAVVEADFQAPSMSVLFDLKGDMIGYTFGDYMDGNCDIEASVYDVTSRVAPDIRGRIWLMPAKMEISTGRLVVDKAFDPVRFGEGLCELIEAFSLDAAIVDISPGVEGPGAMPIALCDIVLVLMRPDVQYYQGTGVVIELARKLEASRVMLIVNEVLPSYDYDQVKADVEKTYDCEVAAVLPYTEDMMVFGSAGIFTTHYPDHPLTAALRQVADQLKAEIQVK